MGNELSCPCISKNNFVDETPRNFPNIEQIQINSRFYDETDILYTYTYGFTKINLIKTGSLENFFTTKNVLKYSNKKEVTINL